MRQMHDGRYGGTVTGPKICASRILKPNWDSRKWQRSVFDGFIVLNCLMVHLLLNVAVTMIKMLRLHCDDEYAN